MPELQIREGIEDNSKIIFLFLNQNIDGIEVHSKIIFLFLNQNICCDPSLEPSQ